MISPKKRKANGDHFRSKGIAKLQKAKIHVDCKDKRIGHYRLTNDVGAQLDYWATTTTWLIPGSEDRGSGLAEAMEKLKGMIAPPPRASKEYTTPLTTIFSDASYDYKTHAAGWAAWVKAAPNEGSYDSGPTNATSAVEAEMNAIANGLQFAVRRGILEAGGTALLQSDCLNALAMIRAKASECRDAPASGGHRVPVARKIRAMDSLDYIVATQKRLGLRLLVRHVKGHTGNDDARSFVNAECDRRARAAMRVEQRARREANV